MRESILAHGVATATVAAVAAACTAKPAAAPRAGSPLATTADAAHLLSRCAFGPRPGEPARLVTRGLDAWLAEQTAPARLADAAGDAALAPFVHALADPDDLVDALPMRDDPADRTEVKDARRAMLLATQMTALARHVASTRQLHEVLADFWTNHFNVSARKGAVRFLAADFVERAIRPHTMGRFADLLLATARHPAMLIYLDNAQSLVPRPGGGGGGKRARGLNENYARELLELHTLGVDGGYTQADVIAVARVLSGWSVAERTTYVFRARAHDAGAKHVLGHAFAAGGGEEEGQALLAMLARHPATIRHVSRRLCMRLVADDPPADVVAAASSAWRASDGRIAEVVRTIVLHPAFWAAATRGNKVKTPLEVVVSAARAAGGSVDGDGLARTLERLGQGLFVDPVPTGYSDDAAVWVSTAGALERMNVALAIAANKLPGLHVELDAVAPLPTAGEDLTAWRAHTLARLDEDILGGAAAPHTRQVIAAWLERAISPDKGRRLALALALGSPEFQRQ